MATDVGGLVTEHILQTGLNGVFGEQRFYTGIAN